MTKLLAILLLGLVALTAAVSPKLKGLDGRALNARAAVKSMDGETKILLNTIADNVIDKVVAYVQNNTAAAVKTCKAINPILLTSSVRDATPLRNELDALVAPYVKSTLEFRYQSYAKGLKVADADVPKKAKANEMYRYYRLQAGLEAVTAPIDSSLFDIQAYQAQQLWAIVFKLSSLAGSPAVINDAKLKNLTELVIKSLDNCEKSAKKLPIVELFSVNKDTISPAISGAADYDKNRNLCKTFAWGSNCGADNTCKACVNAGLRIAIEKFYQRSLFLFLLNSKGRADFAVAEVN